MNPLPHIDPLGSVILPTLLALSGTGFIFAWAKPVPFNPYNLKSKWGEAIVSAAGPAANLFLAVVFGLILRFFGGSLGEGTTLVATIVVINLFLALFNLVPIPPLDGSKLLFSILPHSALRFRALLEQYGFFLVLLFAFFFADLLIPVAVFVFSLITGIRFM
jgi:Zn-dependent protease